VNSRRIIDQSHKTSAGTGCLCFDPPYGGHFACRRLRFDDMIIDTPVNGVSGGKMRQTSPFWGLGAVLSISVALFSYRYMPQLAFGAPLILANTLSRPWLYMHIIGAATALLIAPFQLLPALRRGRGSWHRWLGRIYMICCLLGGVGGFVSAFGSTAGPVATAGFASLAMLWVFVNSVGWLRATQSRFAEHRRWMIYSFALTFAAVTLRLYLPIFPLLHLSFVVGYRTVAWMSWVGNLIAAEIYLRAADAKKSPR
jgi:hypothetical protein